MLKNGLRQKYLENDKVINFIDNFLYFQKKRCQNFSNMIY